MYVRSSAITLPSLGSEPGATNSTPPLSLVTACSVSDESLKARLAETLQAVTKLKGGVEFVAPGSLPNDGKVIADERTYT